MRNYVTQAEVHSAADDINETGENPSVKAIRKTLGRGSFSTIQHHLKGWIPKGQRDSLPPVPPAMMIVVETLAADVWHLSLQTADGIAAEITEEVQRGRDEAQAAADALAERVDDLQTKALEANALIATLTQSIAEREEQIQAFQEWGRSIELELAKKSAEVEVLRRTLTDFGVGLKIEAFDANEHEYD